MNGNVIGISGVRVRFGELPALRDVSLTVAEGEIYAVLGRPGAGKTTLLEVAAGLRRPEAGTAGRRDGARWAAVWAEGGLFPGLTVAEVVDTWRHWTSDPLPRDEALGATGLTALLDTPFELLSRGQKRRLDLSLAMLGRPEVLFLDEPTAGFGATSTNWIWSALWSLAANGVTVMLATSDPRDACRANRHDLLAEGRLLPAGALNLDRFYAA
ncbi:ABC transporter ATP-binding protein [Actinomadura fulvescens]|uniref:ABC transporter domain-containing protein n=1 Tax=Actinomadura fulvescens TaxID=46160 RepID=A0ABN3PN35_9ACTN